MKKYIVEISETAEQDVENIINYLGYNIAGDIIADKYKKNSLSDVIINSHATLVVFIILPCKLFSSINFFIAFEYVVLHCFSE